MGHEEKDGENGVWNGCHKVDSVAFALKPQKKKDAERRVSTQSHNVVEDEGMKPSSNLKREGPPASSTDYGLSTAPHMIPGEPQEYKVLTAKCLAS